MVESGNEVSIYNDFFVSCHDFTGFFDYPQRSS
jgi:hypothetical protein